LSLLRCSFSLAFAFERVLANQEGSKLNGTHQHQVYAVDVNLLGQSIHTIKKNTEDQKIFLVTNKKIDLEVNTEKAIFVC
jgi:hypothetical protein